MSRILTACFLLIFHFSFAQVTNDNINQRHYLQLNDKATPSTTANSSVEWQCINKNLTNRCLVYHNDQWFSFNVDTKGTYFLNLSAQTCKKEFGTQLILLEGNPCEVKTYRILKCISKLPLEDTFIQMDSLKPGVTYLVNIDGFLGDFCGFNIQLNTTPSGFAITPDTTDPIIFHIKKEGKVIKLAWQIEENESHYLKEFAIHRKSNLEAKGKIINTQSITRNAYGAAVLNYYFTDTLKQEGNYEYKILGIESPYSPFMILSVEHVTYSKQPESKKPIQFQRELLLNLNYEDDALFKVVVLDPQTQEEHFKYQGRFSSSNKSFKIDLGQLIDKGKRQFLIITSDFSSNGSKEFYFTFNSKGELVKQ